MAGTGLKRDIIVVNEFSVPLPSAGGKGPNGTRGGTPGDYVLRYMARAGATESLAPIRKKRTDLFIQRYMARESATEALDVDSTGELKSRLRAAQGVGGVAFGYGQVSLSDESLRAASADVQRLFESGHTVMKTVLSFDEEYLRRHKIIPEDLSVQRKGAYRGHVDQMKLRLAIMNGLDRMGRTMYDDLRYVAVIQVDTLHVHCHLAMVDAGEGTKAHDGTQRGMLGDRAKSVLRRGVDSALDEKQAVKHLSSAVGYERRNVATYVKRWAHQQMLRESLPQFLLACLPADRRQWRYSTNAKGMKKPNRIAKEIVENVLEQPGSPMPKAMERVTRYANHRRKLEGLNKSQWKRLVDQGRERIIERGVNGIYAQLRALPTDAVRIKTPMLDVMGLDYEEIAARAAAKRSARHNSTDDHDLVGFGFRLRSYSARLDHHLERREHYYQQARQWESAHAAGVASEDSRPVHEFYLEEEQYHARVGAKYRSLLNFIPSSVQWRPWVDEVVEHGERLLSLQSLRKDQSLRKMKDPQEAEALGMDIYGQRGGALVALGDTLSLGELDRRIALMRSTHDTKIDQLRMKLAAHGLSINPKAEQETGDSEVEPVIAAPEFDFETVKALDLHHMRFDFSRDVEVGPRGRATFQQWTQRRQKALAGAIEYLENSDQAAAASELPVRDIEHMAALAKAFADGSTELPSETKALSQRQEVVRRSHTVRLGTGISQEIQASVITEVSRADEELDTGVDEIVGD